LGKQIGTARHSATLFKFLNMEEGMNLSLKSFGKNLQITVQELDGEARKHTSTLSRLTGGHHEHKY
jgi:hypothetical protein